MPLPYVPIVPFLEDLYRPWGKEAQAVPELWARVLKTAFTPDANMRLPYTTVVLSAPKKCLARGERLWLTDGRFVPCEELIDQEFRVWAYDGTGYVAADASAWVQGVKQVVEIKLWSGRVLRRSVGHKVMAWDGWLEAEKLTPGQKVALPLQVPEPESPRTDISPELARFMGYMIGDGGLTGKSTPVFSQNAGPILDDFKRCAAALGFGVSPRTAHAETNDYSITNGAAELCRQHGMLQRNSYEHRVPDAIWQSSNAIVAEFLGALYAADGCAHISDNGSTGSATVSFCSMSGGLVGDIQALLSRFGIFPYLRTFAAKGRRADHAYRLTITDQHDVSRFAQLIGIPGKEAALKRTTDSVADRWMVRARKVDQLCPLAWRDLERAKIESGLPWVRVVDDPRRKGPPRSTWAANREKVAEWAANAGAEWLTQKIARPFAWDEVVSVDVVGEEEVIGVNVPQYGNHLAHEVSGNSAKSSYAGGIALWFACCMSEPYGELVVCANKKDQAKEKVFEFIKRAIGNNVALKRYFKCQRNDIVSEDGTRIWPITTEAGGEAGANPELIIHDELWGATSEADERLFAELTTVPTRRNSIRLITSYAGYLGSSNILYRVYENCMTMQPHPEFLDLVDGNGDPIVRHDPATRTLCMWETEQRMPWQVTDEGKQYYVDQERSLRRSDFLRLHKNQWVSNEEGFNMDSWDACVDPDYDPFEVMKHGDQRLYLAAGADASYRKDLSAVVTMFKRDGKFWVGPYAIWAPEGRPDFDFEATIEAFILGLKQRFRLRDVYYDPYQLHRSAMTLRRASVRMIEFKQTEPNTKLMGGTLDQMIRDRRIVLPADAALRHQATSTSLRISPEGIQLKKGGMNKKIDAIVAMSMALLAAHHLPDLGKSLSDDFMFV